MRAPISLSFDFRVLVGCGDDGVNIDSSAESVCGEIAEVACHNLYNCCTENEIETFLDVTEPRTQEQCYTDVQRSCERGGRDARLLESRPTASASIATS